MSQSDDEAIGALIATGILVAVGYGLYRLAKSFGNLEKGEEVPADVILAETGGQSEVEVHAEPYYEQSSQQYQRVQPACSECGSTIDVCSYCGICYSCASKCNDCGCCLHYAGDNNWCSRDDD